MEIIKRNFLFGTLVFALLSSGNTFAAKKEMKGLGLDPFPDSPNMENLYIDENAKKVSKLDSVCIGGFNTSFIQQSVV